MPRTIPGTDTKVTPESEAPIIPNATTYQGDFRFPRKKASLSACRLVNLATNINKPKYPKMVRSI